MIVAAEELVAPLRFVRDDKGREFMQAMGFLVRIGIAKTETVKVKARRAGLFQHQNDLPVWVRRGKLIGGNELRFDVDRNAFQSVEHLLRSRADDDQLVEHLFRGVVIAVRF